MNFFDIQMYIGIKLLLLLFMASALYLIYKKKNPAYFLILAGGVSAASYFLLVNNLQLSFWGLQGDEITIAAMYNTFARASLWSDFAYHHLPPFYPPLFFWLFALAGRLLGWNGIMIAKSAAFSFFLFFPAGLYYFQKYLLKNEAADGKISGTVFTLLSPLLIITILDKDLLIGKPYEVIAAAATIFWYISLYLKISQGKFSHKQALIHGLIAGLIFMTYYLWLVFAAIALFLMGAIEKSESKIKYFLSLFKTMLIALLAASPFLLPLLISYLKNGMENWQTAFFTPGGVDLWLPMFHLGGINNFIMLFGLAALIYYRNYPLVKQLLYLFLTAFIWWGGGLLSLLIFNKPFQEFRGFYILAPSILMIAAAYGLERLWHHFNVNNKNLYFTVAAIGVAYFTAQSVFGFFADDPIIKMRRVKSREANRAIVNLADYLKKTAESSAKLTLETAPQLLAFTPINNLIYFNQHNNHPASIFSKRYQYVQSLADSQSAEDFYQKVKKCPYGRLERFILYGDQDNYYLFFHLNKMISGLEEKKIKISKKLFSPRYFAKTYDNNGYAVINVIAP
ncbi:MAG: hypothetical protein Q7R92_02100 [bacterium]|nr:hypothetical protein [bacterium]